MSYTQAPHLCGTIRGAASACPNLVITGREAARDLLTGRTMKPFAVYCIRDGRLKKLGNVYDWTGLTPKGCPKREEWERENHAE